MRLKLSNLFRFILPIFSMNYKNLNYEIETYANQYPPINT